MKLSPAGIVVAPFHSKAGEAGDNGFKHYYHPLHFPSVEGSLKTIEEVVTPATFFKRAQTVEKVVIPYFKGTLFGLYDFLANFFRCSIGNAMVFGHNLKNRITQIKDHVEENPSQLVTCKKIAKVASFAFLAAGFIASAALGIHFWRK